MQDPTNCSRYTLGFVFCPLHEGHGQILPPGDDFVAVLHESTNHRGVGQRGKSQFLAVSTLVREPTADSGLLNYLESPS
jgi:hypothetical protein